MGIRTNPLGKTLGLGAAVLLGASQSPAQPPAGTPASAPSQATTSDGADDLTGRIDAQKAAQAQLDQAARRLDTMLRVLRYQKLEAHEEHKLVQEASQILKGLSEREMNEVLGRLEIARKAPAVNAGETDKAFEKHLVIMSKLRELGLRRDAVRSLAEAAARARKTAREQGRLQGAVAGEIAAATAPRQSARAAMGRISQAIDSQRDLNTEVSLLMRQASALENQLDLAHKAKLKKGLDEARNAGLLDRMNRIPSQLSADGVSQDRAGRLRPVLEESRQAAETLLTMARLWREDEPATAALRRLDERAAAVEEKLAQAREQGGATGASEEERREAQELQAEVTREAFDLSRDAVDKAPEAAQPLREAADQLRAAQEKNLNSDPMGAKPLEERARESLAKARQKLDELMEKREKEKTAKKEAEHKERLDKLAKNEAELAQKTKQAAERPEGQAPMSGTDNDSLARKQAELARETIDLAKSATNEEEGAALKEAAKALTDATKNLADKQTPADNAKAAVPEQEKGMKALDKARKELASAAAKEKAAEEARKKHEKAAKLLADAAKTQEDLAKKTESLKEENKLQGQQARDLVLAEEKVKGQVAEAMKELAGDAAGAQAQAEAGEASRELNETIQDLKSAKQDDAARDARQAADALADAARLASDLVDKDNAAKAMDQARKSNDLEMLPEASRRIERALKDAKNAANLAAKAQEALKNNPTADLARAQGKLAAELKASPTTDKAAPDADKAAADLRESNLAEAIKDQTAALGKLEARPEPSAKAAAAKQKELIEAAKALEQSGQAAAQAETGTEQAEGLVPGPLLPALNKAEAALKAGEKAAMRGDAREAARQQADAVKRLENALSQLMLLAKANEGKNLPEMDPFDLAKADPMEGQPDPSGQPMNPQDNKNNKNPSKQPKGNNSGPDTPQSGEKLDPAQLKDAEGMGRFLRLPAREREALLQAWTEGLPPTYAAMVQKYFRDLARGAEKSNPPANPRSEP